MPEQIEINEIIESAEETFAIFCDDIATMFDVSINGKKLETSTGTFKDLRKKFRKICCLWVFNDKGTLNKDFYAMVDQEGLFTLGGTFVMHPDQIILKNRNHGGKDESKDIEDAVGEVGNLLSGSFDRFFRDNFEGHQQIKQTNTTVDNFSLNLEIFNGDKQREFNIVDFEMELEPFDPFVFSIIFPNDQSKPQQPQAEDKETSQENKEQKTEPEKQENKPKQEPENNQPQKQSEQTEKSQQTEPEPEKQQEKTQQTETEKPVESPVSTAIKNLVSSSDSDGKSLAQLLDSLSVDKFINKDVVWVTLDDSLESVLNTMQNKAVDHVLVGTDGRAEGVLSKNDIYNGMSPYLKPVFSKLKRNQDIATLKFKIKWLMSQPVYSVSIKSNLREAVKMMADNKIGFVPVVDQDGKVAGTVSVRDVLLLMLG